MRLVLYKICGSSNLLVKKIKFVALRILVLSVMLNNVFPKGNVSVKMELAFCSSFSVTYNTEEDASSNDKLGTVEGSV